MDVISRREQESVVIGDEIVVTVLEVGRAHVRLAIDSPSDGYREETLLWNGERDHSSALELTAATH